MIPVIIERSVFIAISTGDDVWMGDITYESRGAPEDDVYWASPDTGEMRGFDTEADAIAYIEECWEEET